MMIEKICRAMGMAVYEKDGLEKAQHIGDGCWQDWIPEARAALTALLEPSEGMVTEARYTISAEPDTRADTQEAIREGFTAAIQAALDEREG